MEKNVAPDSSRPRILVVEDDKKMAAALHEGLEAAGYDVAVARTGEEGFFLVHTSFPHVLILDLNLPQRDGMEVLRQIRAQALNVRILIVSSHNTIEDRVAGLNAGADDYLGKPFSFPELLARIGSLLRRSQPSSPDAPFHVADLVLDIATRTASRSDHSLDLTTREFDLLLYLAENRGHTVSREMLAKHVWKESSRFTPLDNVMDVQMARLRRKVDDPFPVKLLQTIRGVGFILREPKS